MDATADVAGEKVGEARQRLAAALERGKEMLGVARERAVEGGKIADLAMHEKSYQVLAVGVGAGVMLGYLVARRCLLNCD